MNKVNSHHSCLPAINQVPKKDQEALRLQLMEIFGNPCRTSYYKYTHDYRNIPFNLKTQIDELFISVYSLSPESIWEVWFD